MALYDDKNTGRDNMVGWIIAGVVIVVLAILLGIWVRGGNQNDPSRMSSRNTTGTTTQSSAPPGSQGDPRSPTTPPKQQ
jgi:hypothetical protein